MRRAGLALAALALAATGCGGGGSGGSGPIVRVAAASSLQQPLEKCAASIPRVRARLEFGGSDTLAAQIRAGVRPDVFAAANTGIPRKLARDGLAAAPVAFAGNQLVLAVPAADKTVRSVSDLARGNPSIAIGSVSVPVGIYTREVLARLPLDERITLLAHVRSQEPDVQGIVGKLASGAVDAGFVYRSDVEAAGGKLRAIALPAALRPTVTYALVAVRGGSAPPSATRRVIADLLHGGCAKALRRAGFGPPPR